MKIPEEIQSKIMQGDLKTLYDHVRLLAQDYPEINKELQKIRQGINLRFNINFIFNNHYVEKKKANLIIIDGQELSLPEYWAEMETREDLARQIIYEYLDTPESIKPRSVQ